MKKGNVKGLCIILICACVMFGYSKHICYAAEVEDIPKETELYAKSAVLMDADSGRILYSKNGTNAMANASTTKILTCILALEYGQMDAIVTASQRAASAPKVHLGMKAGQKFYMRDMLYALMLESYNDCAVAIAEHIAGDVESFAELMNQKAIEIGCQDTYFITPNGLDAVNEKGFHHTTARDLALLMRYCVMQSGKQEEFREITATRSHCFYEIDSKRSYTVNNKNVFLDMMQGAFSGKTGFTGNAGYCYVGALTRDNRTYIVTLLACGWPNNKNYKWSDSKKLMKYGIDNFERIDLCSIDIEEEKLGEILVLKGQTERIGENAFAKLKIGGCEGYDTLLLPKGTELKFVYQLKKEWNAPLLAETKVGRILLVNREEVLRTYYLVTTETVPVIDFSWCLQKVVEQYLEIVLSC